MAVVRKLRRLGVKFVLKLRRARDFIRHRDPVDTVLAEVRAARPEPEWANRVVVVTGSTRGIGWAVAQGFLQRGCRVVINGRRADALRDAAARLGEATRVHAVCADVATAEGAQRLIDEAVGRFGAVDLLINSAATLGPTGRRAWEIDPADWQRTLASNLTGPYLCAAAFMRWAVGEGRRGRIINVSSGAANAPAPGLLPYALSKSALDVLTRNLAVEAEGTGIVVTGVQLGSTKTEMARRYFPWHEYELLPPPETVLPVFWHAASASASLLNGRVIASWRFLAARDAEARLAAPISLLERFRFVEQKVPEHVAAADRALLNRAENQFGVPPAVRAMFGRDAVDVSRYPDPDYGALRRELAQRLGLEPGGLTFGNGSAELVERALKVFVRPGEAAVSNEPSWFMFDRFAYALGVRNDKVPFLASADEGFDHNLDGVLAALRADTRLIYLVSPSNPVGVPILHEAFLRFLERVPAHIPVVVDEAYREFADRPDVLDAARLMARTDRLLIGLRTFSKFYGLAGLRVGYAFGRPQTIDLLDRGELLFPISSLAAEAARVALLDATHARRTHDSCVVERRRVLDFLRAHGLRSVPSQSNMLLFEPPTAPDTLFDALEQRGIVPARGVVLDDYVLWPIGLPAQNDRIITVVRSFR